MSELQGTFVTRLKLPLRLKLADGREIFRNRLVSEWADELYAQDSQFLGVSEEASSDSPQLRLLHRGDESTEADLWAEPALAVVRFFFRSAPPRDRWRHVLQKRLGQDFGFESDLVLDRDWNEEWRRHFTGVDIPPFWRVVPTWQESTAEVAKGQHIIRMNPSMGFGTGTHPTTQLCLEALGERAAGFDSMHACDFGAGSGILSVALALMGASVVDAVEIDDLAIEGAFECAQINQVADRIRFSKALPGAENLPRYDLIVANILSSILIPHAQALCGRLKSSGEIILSGLLFEDLEPVSEVYRSCLGDSVKIERKNLGEWWRLILSR